MYLYVWDGVFELVSVIILASLTSEPGKKLNCRFSKLFAPDWLLTKKNFTKKQLITNILIEVKLFLEDFFTLIVNISDLTNKD